MSKRELLKILIVERVLGGWREGGEGEERVLGGWREGGRRGVGLEKVLEE